MLSLTEPIKMVASTAIITMKHAHDYIYDENGNLVDRTIRELSDKERKENDDIL